MSQNAVPSMSQICRLYKFFGESTILYLGILWCSVLHLIQASATHPRRGVT